MEIRYTKGKKLYGVYCRHAFRPEWYLFLYQTEGGRDYTAKVLARNADSEVRFVEILVPDPEMGETKKQEYLDKLCQGIQEALVRAKEVPG